jgi:hypothetical protein
METGEDSYGLKSANNHNFFLKIENFMVLKSQILIKYRESKNERDYFSKISQKFLKSRWSEN